MEGKQTKLRAAGFIPPTHENIYRLRRVLASLSEIDATLVWRVHIERLPLMAVAKALGLDPSDADARYGAVLRDLRREFGLPVARPPVAPSQGGNQGPDYAI